MTISPLLKIMTDVTFENVGTLNFTEHAETIDGFNSSPNTWRFAYRNNNTGTKSDILQRAVINSNKNLELKLLNAADDRTSGHPTIPTGVLLNYYSKNQSAFNLNLSKSIYASTGSYWNGVEIEFEFLIPSNDFVIFSFSNYGFGTGNSVSSQGFPLTAFTLYKKNNNLYVYIATSKFVDSNRVTDAVIGEVLTNPTVGSIHKYKFMCQRLDIFNYNAYAYLDDIKIADTIIISPSGPGNPEAGNIFGSNMHRGYFTLEGDDLIFYNNSGTVYNSPGSSSDYKHFFFWGPGLLSFADGSTWTSSSTTTKVNIRDINYSEFKNGISYLKNPLPAQNNYNLSIGLDNNSTLELKSIKISDYILVIDQDIPTSIKVEPEKTQFEKNILDPIEIAVPSESSTDLFPIDIEVPLNEYKEDLFSISVPVKDDFSSSLLDPIIIEVQLDKSETDLFNITLDVDAPVYQLELGPEFVSGWDDRKYLVFRNGHLLPKQTYNIIIPSHHNNYLKKILYSTVGFSKGDRIEIFYIENQENFANVPFNRETRVASYIYYAKSNNQKLIKIPYPNSSYRRSKDSFYLFNDKGEHLDCRFDYTVSVDGRYVTLADHAKLKVMMLDYVVFTFCYIQNRSIDGQEQETDMFDTVNLAEIEYEYSYSLENINDTSGTVVFSPPFDKWPNINKENFMLFGNSVYIDPERYEIIDNSTIQFVDPVEAEVANSRRYTMCIPVHQTKLTLKADTQIHYEVVRVIATKDKQSVFTLELPDNSTSWYPFLLFKGSILLDVYDQYEFDDTTGILTITDPECYVSEGRALTIVYLNKSYTDIKKEIKYVKMEFNVTPTGMTEIPLYFYKNKDIKFNSSNLLLFVNGVFIEPERYTIEPDNWIKFNSIPEIAGYDEPYEDKSFTGIYMMAYEDPDSNSDGFNDLYGQKEVDPSEDNDKTRFDELYSRVERKPD